MGIHYQEAMGTRMERHVGCPYRRLKQADREKLKFFKVLFHSVDDILYDGRQKTEFSTSFPRSSWGGPQWKRRCTKALHFLGEPPHALSCLPKCLTRYLMNNREFRYLLQTLSYLPRSLFPSSLSSLILPFLSKTNANTRIRVKSTTDETARSIHLKHHFF